MSMCIGRRIRAREKSDHGLRQNVRHVEILCYWEMEFGSQLLLHSIDQPSVVRKAPLIRRQGYEEVWDAELLDEI